MAKTITITVPDDTSVDFIAEYVHVVADQIGTGYTSGVVDVDHHWEASPL